jgi:hypothetical protein
MNIKAGSQFEGNGASPGQNKVEIKLKKNPEAVKTQRAAGSPNFQSRRFFKFFLPNSSKQTETAKIVISNDLR